MADTISIANLPTGTPSTDDILVFVDRADGVTKRADISELPGGGSGDMLASTYDPAGIAQQIVGTTATQTLTNKTLTAPKFVDNGFIADSNGNEMLAFNQNASAVNYLELENGTTTNPPHLRSKGDDTNIGLHLVGKGTGEVSVCDATDETKRMRFNIANNGTGIITTLRSNSTSTSKTIDLPNATDTLVGRATTDTLTNKRITKRVETVVSSATPASNTDSYDVTKITGLATAITSLTTNLTGTPTDGDLHLWSFTDNGTARAITPGASFENSTVSFPTTTVISTRLDVLCIWNSATSKWRVVATA